MNKEIYSLKVKLKDMEDRNASYSADKADESHGISKDNFGLHNKKGKNRGD